MSSSSLLSVPINSFSDVIPIILSHLKKPVLQLDPFLSISWPTSYLNTKADPVCHPNLRFPFVFSAFWSHLPLWALGFLDKADQPLSQHLLPVAPWRWLDSTHNCSSCDERHYDWRKDLKINIFIDEPKNIAATHHSPMWKTLGPLTTIANNFFLRHWWLVVCKLQSQL